MHSPDDATTYRLTTWWCFDAPLEPVWNAIADADGWPAWWPGIASVVLAPGDPQGLGAVRRYTCRGALPLRLSFVARVTRIVPQRLIEGRACGDLVGRGRCSLACAQGRTTVHLDWQVRTASAWLNRLAPLIHPLLRWNHDRLTQAGGQGLERYLAQGAAMNAFKKESA
ncbi:SRPBCC family protein [Paenacidovorax monticola]|uniref:SRPBCC family protein n=1 Tax=Paenacidovorax monticola TaxID=1926868 RepID=A0A7H0HC23_9BURK|nr:SRPBCC family protein [Paenacidovorax monticola]QNP58089.1 SRPBCC family protein [Paenacidovorax monticola]